MDTRPSTRPDPFFIGDHLALDFLNSTASPRGVYIEWIGSGADLISWLVSAKAIDVRTAALFRGKKSPSSAVDAVAGQARELREWLRRFVKGHVGKPLTTAALRELEPLNKLLAEDNIYRQIDTIGPGMLEQREGYESALRWRQERRWGSPEQLLHPIAEAIGDLLCRVDFKLVRQCEGEACTLMFHDVTKAHARRWCSMAVCGNRAKAAAHRARLSKYD
jgi:predicted RNA-binding Zn ribbon-like protein